MTDQELRALVRDAVARHMGPRASAPANAPPPPTPIPRTHQAAPASRDPSHAVYVLINTSDECVIEPSVPCNHCNYCKSHGH